MSPCRDWVHSHRGHLGALTGLPWGSESAQKVWMTSKATDCYSRCMGTLQRDGERYGAGAVVLQRRPESRALKWWMHGPLPFPRSFTCARRSRCTVTLDATWSIQVFHVEAVRFGGPVSRKVSRWAVHNLSVSPCIRGVVTCSPWLKPGDFNLHVR
jgi:hypothetical protein